MDCINVAGIILPNRSLTSVDLDMAVKLLNIPTYRGWYCVDTLPKHPHRDECGILNLEKLNKGKGTYWVAWYTTSPAVGDKPPGVTGGGNNVTKIYFDSYGVDPPLELVKYLGPVIYCNTDVIQPLDTVVCGHLCLYVLKMLSDGYDYLEILNSLI
jgi:hypothetical protein